jgi:hypothetical protein
VGGFSQRVRDARLRHIKDSTDIGLPAGLRHSVDRTHRAAHLRLGIEVEHHAKRQCEIRRRGRDARAIADVAHRKISDQLLPRDFHETRRVVHAGQSQSWLDLLQGRQKPPRGAAEPHRAHPRPPPDRRHQRPHQPVPTRRVDDDVGVHHMQVVGAAPALGLPDLVPILLSGHDDRAAERELMKFEEKPGPKEWIVRPGKSRSGRHERNRTSSSICAAHDRSRLTGLISSKIAPRVEACLPSVWSANAVTWIGSALMWLLPVAPSASPRLRWACWQARRAAGNGALLFTLALAVPSAGLFFVASA